MLFLSEGSIYFYQIFEVLERKQLLYHLSYKQQEDTQMDSYAFSSMQWHIYIFLLKYMSIYICLHVICIFTIYFKNLVILNESLRE